METKIDLRIEKNVELLQAALLVAWPAAAGALTARPEMLSGGCLLASRTLETGEQVWGWSADPRCQASVSQRLMPCPLGGVFFSRFYSIGD